MLRFLGLFIKMAECPIVETKLGKIKGKTVNNVEGGKDVFRYSSVPFAKPPVGELRFEPPVEPESWNGVLDGTSFSAKPVQDLSLEENMSKFYPFPLEARNTDMSEDCLYLSVYTRTTSKTANLPVLFWIYGGAFNMGSDSSYDGSVLAGLHDVVVVIPNYRVSVFGFLSLGSDSDYPGNVGLLDQIMALKWTREHIKNFGGNPDNITIMGESAGGMSVNYHVVSPMSKGLFAKAISHSGSLYTGEYPQQSGEMQLNMLLEELKITEKDPKEIVKKLKSLPSQDITNAIKDLMSKMIYFTPVIDGKFFPKEVAELAKEKVHPVPYIVGCNNTEGNGHMTMEFPEGFANGISKEVCMESLKFFLSGSPVYAALPNSAYELMVERYIKGKENDPLKWSKVCGEILGDVMFTTPALKSVKHHIENHNPTYMYVMTQTPQFNHDSNYGPETARKVPFCKCDHGDDLVFTFGLPLCKENLSLDVKFTDNEKLLSREWMKYITNFAINGDPNVGESVKVKWPKYDEKEAGYLSVQQPCTAGKKYGAEQFKFWGEVIEPMHNSPEKETKGDSCYTWQLP